MSITTENTKKIKEGFIGQKMIVLPPNILKQVHKNPLTKNFHLTAIGYYPHAGYHDRERKQGSQEYILLYCIEGEGFLLLEDKKLHLKPNTFAIVPPSKPHHYNSSINNPWSICWIHFTGDHASLLYSRYKDNNPLEINPIPYDENRLNIFFQIISILKDSFSDRHLETAAISLKYFLSSLVYDSEISPSSYDADTITESIDYMNTHIKDALKIDHLAKQQHLSVSRYSELFKKKTGFSPIKYFIQLKIQKSCQYLYFTDLSIKEICLLTGFEDPYYFSRMFKKLMGVPPSQYKKFYKE